MEIRLARSVDKDRFVQLALERDRWAWDGPHSYYPPFKKVVGRVRHWRQKFDKLVSSKRLLVACIDGTPAGFLHFTLEFVDYPAAYIELVFVSNKSRRLGMAKGMFDMAEGMMRRAGYHKVFSSTNPHNNVSLAMHKKFGYRRCGFIDGIENPKSRELFLSKELY